jgi:hypothetical protein
MRKILVAIAVLGLGSTSPALACGGLFCDNVNTVDQVGEGVIFAVDDNTVTMQVKITYVGAAADFAWVVPLPAEPTLFVSTNALFDNLAALTEPVIYRTERQHACPRQEAESETDTDTDTDADADADADADTDAGGVTVVSEAEVGPYETVVLQATTTQALVDWLQANAYAVPDTLESALAPYLTAHTNFLALKLQKDKDAGDLEPLGISYPGTKATIPIQLTKIAAADDMPLSVYFLGPARAVPLNYLHLELNPLSIDWFTSGWPTWQQRLAQATDEAGSHAFATLYAGPTGGVVLWTPSMYRTDPLSALTDPAVWVASLAGAGFVGDAELLAVLRAYLPAPANIDESSFYSCPQCYSTEYAALAAGFDPVAATAALVAQIVEPRHQAQLLLEASPYLTRLQSALSADEMTVDPEFGFNPDLPAVDNVWASEVDTWCDGNTAYDANRTFTMPGYTVPVPSERALDLEKLTLDEWLMGKLGHVALLVEQMSESGPGTVITDNRSELEWPLQGLEGVAVTTQTDDEAGGCGCDIGRGGAALPDGLLHLGPLVARRRRVR